ncbi:lipopolysaccharide heptosyltransferase I [Campylobacter sp. MIT 12-8780]|uniref:lipopolysaccharide heptosyltransferase I n=1 Tax=unclassified Campylobacter TaxID=2593542 RepID=UPI00115DBCA8|nr:MULTISPECIES: lipopolysaccharide heptosyltransferase I [unclassified Campylobacter]NDJ28099.1 lipopolysaccharide heptosyltransferase I [Campylobacter sp. MIT 19-121]TQR40471.1 lipopolysaccharide heptosyltransferase I [Campylobacter sp. MIT 12-8780]
MKIAIVKLSALGDIIHSSIVLQFIRKIRPDIELDWFVDARFFHILQDHPLIDKVYALPLKDRKILKILKMLFRLRKKKYDLVIDLQGLLKSAILSRILSPNVFGYDKDSIKESIAANFYNQKFFISYNENIIIRNLALVSFVFNESFELDDILHKKDCFSPKLELKEKLKEEFKLDENEKNILIHVGSSIENKIYPKERFALLCNMLTLRFEKAKIFLCWGNAKEREFAQDIIAHTNSAQVRLLRKLHLQELIAMTKLSDLIIGNDSGPTHLAFAMNKPSITIFGATPSQRNAYQTPINKVIDSGKKITDARHIDKSDFCIKYIDEEKIFELAVELLQ